MNEKTDQVRRDFINWTRKNKNHLPLNSAFWDVWILQKKHTSDVQDHFLEVLGRYDARLERGIPFYKPYSKLVIWNLNG